MNFYPDNKIKIPDRYYLVMHPKYRPIGVYQPGDILPYSKDSTTQKKLNEKKGSEGVHSLFNNEPIIGFKITTDINARYEHWRIDDPRGFSTIVPLRNVSYLLENATIENGHILNSCLWAKHSGSVPILLVVDSDDYNNAENFTKVANTKDRWTNVLPGNIVQLTDGTIGEYLGRFHFIQRNYYLREGVNQLVFSKQKQTVLRITNNNNPARPIDIKYGSNFRLSKIIDSTNNYDPKTAELEVNLMLKQTIIMAGNSLENAIKINEIPVTFKDENEFKNTIKKEVIYFKKTLDSEVFYKVEEHYRTTYGIAYEHLPIDYSKPNIVRKIEPNRNLRYNSIASTYFDYTYVK
jgi:hypothetical protein